METKKLVVVKNSDNALLLPRANERFVIGSVDEVNGAGATEISGYIPTQCELVQLVKHWYGEFLSLSWSFFVTGCTGSYEWRVEAFAEERINRIAKAIGKGVVDHAMEEVREEFRTKVVKDDRLWGIFENGSPEQRDAVQEEMQGKGYE